VVQSSNGSILTSGYTPLSFTGNVGTTFTITASNYGPYTFTDWSNGNTSPTQTVTLSGTSPTLTAYYYYTG
jgi:hypothetical protein